MINNATSLADFFSKRFKNKKLFSNLNSSVTQSSSDDINKNVERFEPTSQVLEKSNKNVSFVVSSPAKSEGKLDYERTVVLIRKDRSNPFVKANFSICIFDYFDFDINQPAFVECFIEKNKVHVQLPERKRRQEANVLLEGPQWKPLYRLEHPVFCAVHRLSEDCRERLPTEIALRGMDVGVSVLLETSDQKILLTRRAYHMRTFPGVWVPPGGHIEEGEDFEAAGLREVQEETGLHLEDVTSQTLGLWESVFPPVLYEGEPKRHHLVVYLLVRLVQSSNELQSLIKIDPEEVDATMWLSQELATIVVEGGVPGHHVTQLHIPITRIDSDDSHYESKLDPKILRKKMPAPGRIVERVSTGTRYALKLWLLQKRSSGP